MRKLNNEALSSTQRFSEPVEQRDKDRDRYRPKLMVGRKDKEEEVLNGGRGLNI